LRVWAAGSAGDASDWAGGTGCPSAWFAGSSGWGGDAGGLVDLKLTETAVDGELDTGLVAGEVGDGIGTHSQHFFAFAGGAEDFVEVLEEQEEIFGILVEQDVFVGALGYARGDCAWMRALPSAVRAGRFPGVHTLR
jgi:hypothetical protein